MKRRILGLVVVLILVNMSVLYADVFEIERLRVDVLVDDVPIDTYDYVQNLDMPAFTFQGRTLLPMRRMFETFGLDVEWNNDERSVTSVTKEGKEIWLQIDNNVVRVNGEAVELDVPAKLVNTRTYVPVRFITETLGYDIEWVNDTREVVITTNDISLPANYKDQYESVYNSVTQSFFIESKEDIDKSIFIQEKGTVLQEVVNDIADVLNVKSEDFKTLEIDKSVYIEYKNQNLDQVYEVAVIKGKKAYKVKFVKFTAEEMTKYVKEMF